MVHTVTPPAANLDCKAPFLANNGMRIVVETDPIALSVHTEAWESLAAAAIEPNPFYEHWMLVPAFREFARQNVRIVFIYDSDRCGQPDALCGVLPIVRRRSYRRLPIPNLSLWKHKYCFHCTPLLRQRFAERALAAYFDWVQQNSTAWSVVEFNDTSGDGMFPELLKAELERRECRRYHVDSFERAMIEPAASGMTYVANHVSNGRRKELRRQFKRLSERRSVEFVELESEEDVDIWLHDFMDLEASGWKGRAGSAMRMDAPSRNFFFDAMREAFRRRRLMMLGLRVDGRPIALKCNLLAEPGAFAFKIAYSEEFGRFSPGLQLELETIHHIHRRGGIQWMDSCAAPRHSMIDHLWAERRKIQTLSVPACGRFALVLLSVMGLRNRSARALSKFRAIVQHAS